MSKSNAVKVVEKNPGTKIDYEQSGTKLFFGDDELMLNVAKYQRDWPVQIDVCADEYSNLVIGVGVGRYYVAQVDVPAIAYKEIETETEGAAAEIAETDNAEESASETKKTTKKEPQPLNMADVVLTLWSMDDLTKTN